MNERELKEKEQQLAQKEQELDRRGKALDGFSAAMDARKKQLYGKLPVTLKQVDTVLWIACGALAVVVILLGVVLAIMRDAIHAKDRLGMLLCTGMMALIGFQSIINIGMTLRLVPVIGITLRFFSAGGSSVATLYLGIGLVLSVCYSSRTRVQNTIFVKKV